MDSRMSDPFIVKQPLAILFDQDGSTVCHLYPPEGFTHQHYGLLVCDLVRHVASAFKVDEDDVWEWVEKERDKQTTTFSRPS